MATLDTRSDTRPETSPVPLAIVGYGRFGRVHAKRARLHSGLALTCIVESNPIAFREAVADGFYAVPHIDSLPSTVEAVAVVTPAATHASLCATLMQRGLHVLVEKPLATTAADIDAVLAAQHRTRKELRVAHIERFNRALTPTPWDMAPRTLTLERTSRAMHCDGGIALDVMVHDLDLAAHLLGLPHNAPFHIHAVTTHPHGMRAHLQLGATTVHLDSRFGASDSHAVLHWYDGENMQSLSLSQPLPPDQTDALTAQYSAFIQALQGASSPIATAAEGAAAVRRALAITAFR